MTSHEKEAKFPTLQAKIQKLQEKIEAECWPKDRRVFDSEGNPMPRQDRWTALLNQWHKVLQPYSAPVDHEGYALEKGSPGWKAVSYAGAGQIDDRINQAPVTKNLGVHVRGSGLHP